MLCIFDGLDIASWPGSRVRTKAATRADERLAKGRLGRNTRAIYHRTYSRCALVAARSRRLVQSAPLKRGAGSMARPLSTNQGEP